MLIRCLHQNPVRINLENGLEYVWSSYNEYLNEEVMLVDREYVLGLFDNNFDKFKMFMKEEEREIKERSR